MARATAKVGKGGIAEFWRAWGSSRDGMRVCRSISVPSLFHAEKPTAEGGSVLTNRPCADTMRLRVLSSRP